MTKAHQADKVFYAVYQEGGPIYGTGSSIQAAMTDAEQWTDNLDGLLTIECSEELHNAVQNDGGDIIYDIVSDTLIIAQD